MVKTLTSSNPHVLSSNFVIVPINQYLGDNKRGIFNPGYPCKGDVSNTFAFSINAIPVEKSYLSSQVFGSSFQSHSIMMDEQNVTDPNGNFSATGIGTWKTSTTIIEDDDILNQDQNTIQIQRNGYSYDDFFVDSIIII